MKKFFKSLISLAIPIIFSNIMQTVYQLIDTFWVGRLGKNAVATISISYPILFLMLSAGIGIAIAGTIYVAQYSGKENFLMINYVSEQTLFAVFFIGTVIAIIGYIFSPEFILWIGANREIFKDAVSYLKLSFIGSIFIYIFLVFQSLLQGIKIVKPPALIVFLTVILNLILDPLFIFKFKMGVKGAAISTIITQFIAAAIGIIFLFYGKFKIKISFKNFSPDLRLIKGMIKLGFPSSVEYITRAFVMALITAIVATFGNSSLAAYGVGIRLFTFVVIIGVGIATATSTLIGHSFGKEDMSEAQKVAISSIISSAFIFFSIAILFFIFSDEISKIFISRDGDAVKLTSQFLKILSLGFIFLAIQISLNGIFRGSGNTEIAMLLTIVTMVGLRLPIAYFFSKFILNSPLGVWIAFPVSNFIASISGLVIFFKGKWKEKRII